MILYVAGPMTGYEHYNFPAFESATEILTMSGYTVKSPHQWGSPLASWETNLKVGLQIMMDCDGVAVMDNWMESTGATIEVSLAKCLGIPVKPIQDWSTEA